MTSGYFAVTHPLSGDYDYPCNYACAGLFPFTQGHQWDGPNAVLNSWLPFEENALFRNFVFDLGDVGGNGNLTTGADNDYGSFSLTRPLTYSFQPGMPLQNLLSYNVSQWLLPNINDASVNSGPGNSLLYSMSDGQTYYREYMSPGYINWFGLPYVSTELAYGNTAGTTATLYPNGNPVNGWEWFGSSAYPSTEQPQFQTIKYCFYRPDYDWLPGSVYFTPTNDSPMAIVWNYGLYATNDVPFLIVPAGSYTQIAGYAKLALLNGYPGVYGYLGQYFDTAYKVDANGNVTTNATGLVSPYGDYFATDVGVAALVTMPDLDTGARGTCMVYSVSLQLDKNHDGTMDLSFNGPDATFTNSPYVFWANNNYDRWATNSAGVYTDVEQDDQLAATLPGGFVPTTDSHFIATLPDGSISRVIPCTRDLEDFARLWICGITTNLLNALPTGSIITLSWGDVGNPNSANPTIDIFQAADADGGIGYLTNETVAVKQTQIATCQYLGSVGPGKSVRLNSSWFNGWAENYFLWCGVSNGTGGLQLTISDSNYTVLAQSTAYIQIKDIKQMYQRWTVGDNANTEPLPVPVLASEGLPDTFRYSAPQNTNTPCILHVHGYNMATWEKDRFAETEYKRLYWQGYQGRFGEFRWPTTVQGTLNLTTAFNRSEANGWASAAGLLNLLTNLDNTYGVENVFLTAHSHGNVVAGEALRLATQMGLGAVVNTYVAMQGAVDSHTYDPTKPVRPFETFSTPDRYGHYYTNGANCYFNDVAGAGTYVNFYNTNDWALTQLWPVNQSLKPALGYGYSSWLNLFYKGAAIDNGTALVFPRDTYTIFSYCDEAEASAIGAQPNEGGAFLNVAGYHQINLPSVWPLDSSGQNYSAHIWHSAEFRSDNPQRWLFWDMALVQMGLKNSL